MNKVYLGLGSNLGNRAEYISKAISEINTSANCDVIKLSSVYESKPYGNTGQPNFFNAILEVETKFSLIQLFGFIKSIEAELGRKERKRWAPREIDIDIILYGKTVYSDGRLTVPHKDMLNRDFVIKPLLELDPGIKHPVTGEKLADVNTGTSNIINKLDLQLNI